MYKSRLLKAEEETKVSSILVQIRLVVAFIHYTTRFAPQIILLNKRHLRCVIHLLEKIKTHIQACVWSIDNSVTALVSH